MSSKEKISVIVPIYNAEKYLEKCLNSIIMQTYSNLEIILIDDGSTDSSPELCDIYLKKDNRIKVLHKKNEGLVAARKSGVRLATGKFITFVDSDDYIEKNMYENLIDDSCDLMICNYYNTFSNQEILNKFFFEEGVYERKKIEEIIVPKMFCMDDLKIFGIMPAVWIKIFKKELLESIIFDIPNEVIIGEDAALSYPYIIKCNKIFICNNPYYHYRQLDNSMMKKYYETMTNDIEKLIDFLDQKTNLTRYMYNYINLLNIKCINNEINNKSSEIAINNLKKLRENKNVNEALKVSFRNYPLRYKIALLIFKYNKINFLVTLSCLYKKR